MQTQRCCIGVRVAFASVSSANAFHMTRFVSRLAILLALLLCAGCAETPERAATKKIDLLLDQGQVQAALDTVERFLREHPHSASLLRMRVVVLLRAERPALATLALRQIPDGSTLLLRLLRHRDAIVRVNAAKLIANQPTQGDFRDLVHALDDPDPNVRRYCARALGQIGNTEALKPLFRLLGDDNWFVRAEAAMALGKIGDPRSVGWLIQLLADADGYVRYSAAAALCDLASGSTQPVLRRGLESASPEQQFGIALALAKLKDPIALGPLTAAVRDKDTDVRRQAAKALGECGQPEGRDALTILLKDPDPDVRNRAEESLQKLKEETRK
jgi:HEAT repeat protein